MTETVHTRVVGYKFGLLFRHLGLSTTLPPLEVVIAAFPPKIAAEMREALAGNVAKAE